MRSQRSVASILRGRSECEKKQLGLGTPYRDMATLVAHLRIPICLHRTLNRSSHEVFRMRNVYTRSEYGTCKQC